MPSDEGSEFSFSLGTLIFDLEVVVVAGVADKFGDLRRTSSLETISERRGMGAGSLRMRVGNFKAIGSGAISIKRHCNLAWCTNVTLTYSNPNCGNLPACKRVSQVFF